MITAVSPSVSSGSAVTLVRRQQRQRMLEWDAAEPGNVLPARPRSAPSREAAGFNAGAPASSFSTQSGASRPRRMGEVMPDVLARYGLKL